MAEVASRSLAIQAGIYNLVPLADRYYIDRLSNLTEQAIDERVKLQEEAQRIVISLLEDVEQIIEMSPKLLTPQKQRLIEICLQNCLMEIIHVIKRTNGEMNYILTRAGSDMENEFVVRKLYNFFKWYIQN